MSTLALRSPQPSTVHLTHLHLELSFIIVIAAGSLANHIEEVGVADIEVVGSAELTPPALERHSQDFVHKGPLQAHEPGLPSHL